MRAEAPEFKPQGPSKPDARSGNNAKSAGDTKADADAKARGGAKPGAEVKPRGGGSGKDEAKPRSGGDTRGDPKARGDATRHRDRADGDKGDTSQASNTCWDWTQRSTHVFILGGPHATDFFSLSGPLQHRRLMHTRHAKRLVARAI